ncbi:hypothetical protein M8J77_011428 [Diaphorina citri]|nr:hypothetical protein M8J77_011428 [Diaphorina citri]
MQTLSVYMKGNQEQLKKVRVLIDTGSQKSYVLTKTAKELGYEPVKKEKVQHALFGGLVTSPTNHDVYLLEVSNLDLSFTCRIEALDQTKICGNVSTVPEGSWLEELKAEGTLEEEQDKVDHYCLLYEQARLLVEKALRVNQVVEAASPPHSEAAVSQECNRKYKLPTLKLKQFNGELQDWLPFWSQFDKIHSDPNLDEIDKFG